MSAKLISLNPELQRLQDEGYEMEVRSGYLLLHAVPYVNSRREVARGILVTNLKLSGDRTERPDDHQVWFVGERPCHADGTPIAALGGGAVVQTLTDGLQANFRFSCKPAGGYADYHEKMTRYVEILSHPAAAIDDSANARTYRPIEARDEDSVFYFTDSASSRAGITALADKLAMNRVAIIGLGGTGSYVLDLTAKTHAREIHLFDGDRLQQHNAFRAPGATSLEVLQAQPYKVDHYAGLYGLMRRGVIPHSIFLDDHNVAQLAGFDFVFICVDKPAVRRLVSDFLHAQRIPFIDVGMELELIDDQALIGTCRVTLSTPDKPDHFGRHVSLDGRGKDDLYGSNIQVADMNALNAVLAVVKWKKFCGFYQDCYQEHQSAYVLNTHQLTRDETVHQG